MKKTLLLLIVVGIVFSALPAKAHASWWNPFSWMRKSVVVPTAPANSTNSTIPVVQTPSTPQKNKIHELTGNEKTITAKIGDTFTLSGAEATVAAVTEDSRCAIGNQCVWAGIVRVKINATYGILNKAIILSLNEPFTIREHTITLISVTPEKVAHKTIAPDDYVFTFSHSVSKKSTSGNEDSSTTKENHSLSGLGALSMMRALGEFYYQSNTGNFAGFCKSSDAVKNLKLVSGERVSNYTCNDTSLAWAASGRTPDGGYGCVDSTGRTAIVNGNLTSGQTACPIN